MSDSTCPQPTAPRSLDLARWWLPLLALGLAWLSLTTLFMTSGAGASWAAGSFGLSYDTDAFNPVLIAITVTFLGSGLGSLAALWVLWRKGEQRPGRHAARVILGGMILYGLTMGVDPTFPLLRFLVDLCTTLYVPLSMLVYLLPGIILWAVLLRLRPSLQARAGLAFLAGLASMRIVSAAHQGWGLFGIADASVRIFAAASALGSYGLGLWQKKGNDRGPS